jgi:hypothetical protein
LENKKEKGQGKQRIKNGKNRRKRGSKMKEKGMWKIKNKKDIAYPVILPMSYRIKTDLNQQKANVMCSADTATEFIRQTFSGSVALRHPFSLEYSAHGCHHRRTD